MNTKQAKPFTGIWYGAKSDDVGLKLTAESVGRGIRDREKFEKITYGIADPSIGKEDGGPSIRERMGVSFRMGDNRRVTGWDNMRQRLKGDENGPMILCFKTCVASIRTIPSLQHDDKRAEDLDTSMEDHAADEWRYMCMSRPWTRTLEAPKPPIDAPVTFDQAIKFAERQRPAQRRRI